jgi:uncharacterized protein (TIGR03435 family)
MSVMRIIVTCAMSVVVVAMTSPLRGTAAAQSAAPKFDVASIKPCAPVAPDAGKGGGGSYTGSPGRVNLQCFPLRGLIDMAYVTNTDSTDPANPLKAWPILSGNVPGEAQRIRGGPAWVYSEAYTIEAKAEGTPDTPVMLGAMLRSLLEERFHVKVHSEVEQVSMYALTVAKGGPKFKPLGPDACIQREPGKPVSPDAIARGGGTPLCGTTTAAPHGPNWTWNLVGVGPQSLARVLGVDMNVAVIDKTALTGLFTLHLEYTPDENTPAAGRPGRVATVAPEDRSGPSIFTALEEQLGLKLEKTRGPRGFIVIDHAERPSPNEPIALSRDRSTIKLAAGRGTSR